MEKTGRLQLDLLDVYGDRLDERVDIILRHLELADVVGARDVDARRRLLIKNLYGTPRGMYRMLIDPPSYLPAASFVNLHASEITSQTYVFVVDPEKVIRVEFPDWTELAFAHSLLTNSRQVLGYIGQSGETLYGGLDELRRAGLLNILAKSRRTVLPGGTSVLENIQELREIRGDRFFAKVPQTLREDIKNSIPAGLFAEASGVLHRPPDGFSPAGSYKTADSYGNLQVSFFARAEEWLADIDIDDAAGLEHAFQVARNTLTGRPTHPFDIQQILIKTQELDPGYRLILREPAAARPAKG